MHQCRQATAEDTQAIWNVRTAAIRGIDKKYYASDLLKKWTPINAPPRFQQQILDHYWIIIENDQVIVATGYLDVGRNEVGAIFVHPYHQGQGHASTIMKEIEKRARKVGIEVLVLDATLNAEEFYQQQGFRSIKYTTYHSPMGFEIECVYMEKNLTLALG